MAQFDVHRSPTRYRSIGPYFVVIQSSRFVAYQYRVIVPLIRQEFAPFLDPAMNPRFVVDEREVVLHPLQIASVPAKYLGPVVASLEPESDRIVAALDLLLSRAWG